MMSEVLSRFIRALRAADVRISISESIDAGKTAGLVGFEDRERLKNALAQVLAKTPEDKVAFEDCFEKFFAFKSFKPSHMNGNGEPDNPAPVEAADNQKNLHSLLSPGGQEPQAGARAPGGEEASGAASLDQETSLVMMLEQGESAQLQITLARAAQESGLERIRLFTQRGMYTRRIMMAMGLEQLEETLEAASRAGDEVRAQRLRTMRDSLRRQVRDYVEQNLELYTANAGRRLREEVLTQMRLSNVDRRDGKLMQDIVRKMAKKLVALHSRRRKKTLRGVLDVRRTIRRNIEYDGLLFDIAWKQVKKDRPKVIVICDVSGSVSQYARFLLMFLYSLVEVLPKVRAFVFSGQLGEVTKDFEKETMENAIARALRVYGGGATDYGKAWEDFAELALRDVDHRTSVIILGDARSNNANPRSDLLDKIHDQAKRVIWLNPEPKSMWNTGDSVMRRFAPHCDRVMVCASLRDLRWVVSDLLRSSV